MRLGSSINPNNCGVRGSSTGGGYFFFSKLKKKFGRPFVCRHYVPQPSNIISEMVSRAVVAPRYVTEGFKGGNKTDPVIMSRGVSLLDS